MITATKVTAKNQRMHCRQNSYESFQICFVRRLRNSEMVNLAIHKLCKSLARSFLHCAEVETHNMAYMILETKTSLLPISR